MGRERLCLRCFHEDLGLCRGYVLRAVVTKAELQFRIRWWEQRRLDERERDREYEIAKHKRASEKGDGDASMAELALRMFRWSVKVSSTGPWDTVEVLEKRDRALEVSDQSRMDRESRQRLNAAGL